MNAEERVEQLEVIIQIIARAILRHEYAKDMGGTIEEVLRDVELGRLAEAVKLIG